ncbi:NPP1 family protein [Sphingomonas yunnanensis]|uniref:NPP1 family protein n=1 Tax=Sphingomonas yunnanensis TaxID=310400 RepID=UPI001CA74E12|nr:NPP1 family protein [Sphingomonas yunnanensis]MBY9062036.1 NPP1 family protein [Sphingomonas yunnanensis]
MTFATLRTASRGAILALAGLSMTAHAATIDHDKVVGFPDSAKGYYKTFQPYLKVFTGCVPFPAVDSAGNTSGGLKPEGTESGSCSKSSGQVYIRADRYNHDCAVMYSWYFPKDQNADGPANNGHRHDWEDVVVWLSSCSNDAKILAVSYSAHGKYEKKTDPHLDGDHPLVAYQQDPAPLDHSVTDTSTKGGTQPAVTWSDLTDAARKALNDTDFGKADVPFKDANFSANLKKAYYK